MPKSKPRAVLSPDAQVDLKRLPGNIRRRMIVEIDNLERDSRPARSKQLNIDEEKREIRRLRLDKWRVIYLVLEESWSFLLFANDHPITTKICKT
jgi:mRNA-degrading endonuclease RelE of RelBE toxin-antitoxin system